MDQGTWRGAGVGALVLCLGGSACAQELYIMMREGPTLLVMDGPTGVVIDSLPILGANYPERGMAIRWDGMLFVTDQREIGDYRLFKIDPATGQGEVIGGPLPAQMATIAADPNTGRLYGTTWESLLYQIDDKTGVATLIGTVANDALFGPPMAMAIGRDGVGYITGRGGIPLLELDLATAETKFLCYLGSQLWFNDMAFDDDGMMWGLFQYDGGVRRADVGTCASETLYYDVYADGVEAVPTGSDCYSDCNSDEVLDLFDFLCFINGFNAGNPYSDCTGDGEPDLFDFLCFVNNFNAGC